jgi:hypothetical protein
VLPTCELPSGSPHYSRSAFCSIGYDCVIDCGTGASSCFWPLRQHILYYLNLYQNAVMLSAPIIVSRMIVLFAAVYVTVRALDNIGSVLLPAWPVTKIWNRWLGNKPNEIVS